MQAFLRVLAALLVGASLFAPLSAYALGKSFGGRVITSLPCLSPTGPAWWVTIRPAGAFPFSYIWAPGSIGLPPIHTGQQILGLFDVPYGCTIGLVKYFGLRIQVDGVSI